MADPIIKLTVTVGNKAPEERNFGVPLIAGFHTRFPDRVREYAQAADMIADGFTTSDPEYQMALIVKQAKPAPRTFKVGRLQAATFTHTVHLTPTLTTTGLVYGGTINGEEIAPTVAPSDTVALVVDKIVADATGIAGVTATDATTHAVVVGAANKLVSFKGLSEHYLVADVTDVDTEDLQADLNEILDEDPAWYELLLTINSPDAILAAAAWTEANGKTFVYQTADTEVLDVGVTDCIASQLVALSYTRTAGIWHRDIGGSEWANAAFGAVNLNQNPGSYTAAFKELPGVSVDNLRAGARSALSAKNMTRYTREYGFNSTYEGKTPSGQFFDDTRFLDWLSYTIEADQFALRANSKKVPFKSSGIASKKGTLEISLKKGVTAGGLDDEDAPPVVTATPLSETAQSDRAQRHYKGLSFTARLAGAIHNGDIEGVVNV